VPPGQPFQEDRAGRPVALESPVRCQPCRCALGLDLLRGLAKGQRLRLGKHVGEEQVVMAAERIERPQKPDEVTGNELGPLMNQLVEGMLSIGTRLAPVDRPVW